MSFNNIQIIYMNGQGWEVHDEVAEWLRRWTANPMGSARVGSNPILVGEKKFLFLINFSIDIEIKWAVIIIFLPWYLIA